MQASPAYATLSWARMFDVMRQYCQLYNESSSDQACPQACLQIRRSLKPLVLQ